MRRVNRARPPVTTLLAAAQLPAAWPLCCTLLIAPGEPPLKDARTRIHHNLVAMLCGRLIQSSQSWQIYREASAAALGGFEAPLRQVVACVRRHY